MPEENNSLAQDLISRACGRYSSRHLATIDQERWTYREIWERGGKLAMVLDNRGINPGDRIGVLMSNQIEYFTSLFACVRGGYAFVPLNSMLTSDELEYILSDSEARVTIIDEEFTTTIADFESKLQNLEEIFAIENPSRNQELLSTVLEPIEETHDYQIDGDDLMMLPYTGGTTGKPKGVKHTHRTIGMNIISHIMELEVGDAEEMLIVTPLAHGAGYMAIAGLIQGAHFTIKSGFDPGEFLSTLHDTSISWSFLVPTQIYRILDHENLESTDVSEINTIVYGAAPITQDRLQEALDVFGDVFIQLYAQTEMPDIGTILSKRDHVIHKEKSGSCGIPAALVDLRIVPVEDETQIEPIGPGEEGEIILRSPYVMEGYFNKPNMTDQTLINGWLRTGDIARMDKDGYVYLLDRKDDMIISGGMNVYTTEVEDILDKHHKVKQVAVIGIPHDDWGEAVHAAVIGRGNLTTNELISFADEHLADYKKPKSIEFVDSIPTTPYGKVDKQALREDYKPDPGS